MAMPDYQSMLLPVLRIEADGADHSVEEIRRRVATELKLTPSDLSAKQTRNRTVFVNFVAWALAQLNMANAIRLIGKGTYRISERGITILKGSPSELTVKDLRHLDPEL